MDFTYQDCDVNIRFYYWLLSVLYSKTHKILQVVSCSYSLYAYDVILIFRLYNRTASLRSSEYNLRIRIRSYACNRYEQITLSYLLSAPG